MKFTIAGIQQMGIGIPNVHEAWKWYRENFSMDVPVFEEAATAELMLPYTGGKPHDRHAILALNLQGGGGMEIWQYTSRTPKGPSFTPKLGDLGIYICKIKTPNAAEAFNQFNKNHLQSPLLEYPDGTPHFYVNDPYGNVFDVVESQNWFSKRGDHTGGIYGAVIGVSDIEASKKFYGQILGYDQVVWEREGKFDDFKSLVNGESEFKRCLLTHSKPREGGFSDLLGQSQIELVELQEGKQKKIFDNRFWGDLGFIHLCFDIVGMSDLKAKCEAEGHPFTVDSANSFDMGEAAGHFSYIEDPDGALIEFVETHKIPIMKKLGWYLDLRKRDAKKSLPKWLIKSLGMNRKK